MNMNEKEEQQEVADLKVVQKYVPYVSSIGQPWREYMCQQCDSELPLQPGYDDKGIHLWCLGYKCEFKQYLGYTTLNEMREFLQNEGVISRFDDFS